jgi:hypothetical protein
MTRDSGPPFKSLHSSNRTVNRLPSDAEVSAWVVTNFDLLTIREQFAASGEFQAVG